MLMKRLFQTVAVLGLSLAVLGSAGATLINDNYIGSNDHGWGDRIGVDHYEIYSLEVNFSGAFLNVRVNTNFDEATDPYHLVKFGDLFISTDGWDPNGSAPYYNDNAGNGEDWEFVFDTDAGSLYGGDFDILTSDDLIPSGYIFRNGQEVQRADNGNKLAGSSVSLDNTGNGGYLEYNILLSSLDLTGSGELGLKWGMSCANDTIEGAVHYDVPEPATTALIALGLLGLGIGARRRKN
jgi:hypothetical protein